MTAAASEGVYPELSLTHITNPSRLWAVPIVGILIKGIILIPVALPLISFEMATPESPSRFFAFPVIGGLVRFILMIPFLIYAQVLRYVFWIGMLLSPSGSFSPGGTPRVLTSWGGNHQAIKIMLIIAGVLLAMSQCFGSAAGGPPRRSPPTVLERCCHPVEGGGLYNT